MRRLAGLLVTCLLLTSLCPSASPAAVRVIRPQSFKSTVVGGDPFAQTPMFVGGAPLAGFFWAPVRLPVGATLTKLGWYHVSNGAGTSAWLARIKMGQNFSSSSHPENEIFKGNCYQDTTGLPDAYFQEVTEPFNAESDLVVRPGYVYFVLLGIEGPNAGVTGVKVYYNPPAP